MKNFNDYTEKAIKRYGLAGQNALASEIGVNKSALSQMNTGKILPSEATMIKLAELAGLPKEEALIDLNLWRSKIIRKSKKFGKDYQNDRSSRLSVYIFFFICKGLHMLRCYQQYPVFYILCINYSIVVSDCIYCVYY